MEINEAKFSHLEIDVAAFQSSLLPRCCTTLGARFCSQIATHTVFATSRTQVDLSLNGAV